MRVNCLSGPVAALAVSGLDIIRTPTKGACSGNIPENLRLHGNTSCWLLKGSEPAVGCTGWTACLMLFERLRKLVSYVK